LATEAYNLINTLIINFLIYPVCFPDLGKPGLNRKNRNKKHQLAYTFTADNKNIMPKNTRIKKIRIEAYSLLKRKEGGN
jgi:hypothetical protein